ncbi:MAG: Rne/Rng family ribonuclease [Phycisphaerales bacterium]
MSSKHQLIINYLPGEECRVAVMMDGKLDEFHSERADNVSHVGNIYVGRVTNVEPAISAAFVDFGLSAGGFLHVSDLHPRYFPGDSDATERVGKKTPRRERPPIQECLKRGQEIIVQVLKEGVGSKGPTLTSYLSIPGRYLVMMPQMDRVGVSRKVEDEDLRKKMKAILDQLDLPDGFGFILRTAGMERTKTELKRDLAYLMRLQKDMERKRTVGSRPRLLYSESDLLVRALRDMVTAETESIIIDHESAVKRAARFMKIVAPRTVTKLIHFTGRTPIFHALGVEQQIRTMYAREVPLPSGGRLVIDETEALVAIDVNSGKSRAAGDSETNALHTNLEAADEICRQLRLRDMGGIVINDLIDMRLAKHRKEVEGKFDEILKADRARSTIMPISEFGILEMTRQRMRGSHESIHFHTCQHCHGRGLVQKPDSVAADAIRELAAVLDHEKVRRVELVVHARVGSELLTSRRKGLARLEKFFAKAVAVRLSDAIQPDRYTIYAYDEQGADIELERLPKPRVSESQLVAYTEPGLDEAIAEAETPEADEGYSADLAREGSDPDADERTDEADLDATDAHPIEVDPSALPTDDDAPNFGQGGRGGRSKRGRRGGSGGAASGTGGGRGRGRDDGPRDGRREPAAAGGRTGAPLAPNSGGGPGNEPAGHGAAPAPQPRGGRQRHTQVLEMVNTPSGGSYEANMPVPPQYADGAGLGAKTPGVDPGMNGSEQGYGDDRAGSGGPGGRRRRRRRGGRGRGDSFDGPDRNQPLGAGPGGPSAAPDHADHAGPRAHSDQRGGGRSGGGPGGQGGRGGQGGQGQSQRFAGLAGAFRAEALSQQPGGPAPDATAYPHGDRNRVGNLGDHGGGDDSGPPHTAPPPMNLSMPGSGGGAFEPARSAAPGGVDSYAGNGPVEGASDGNNEEGGARRRRGRGRGRGGRGGGGGGGGGRDGGRDGGGRNDAVQAAPAAPAPRPAASPVPSAPAPAAPPASAPAKTVKPAFRKLYGFIRKLKPGEHKGGGREE